VKTAESAAALNEEGEEMMESMVVMVDVPPEQVPEEIVNLAEVRSQSVIIQRENQCCLSILGNNLAKQFSWI
jgi:hypothetical protein